MEKFKNKYEIILGYVAIIISLGAFKEELSTVKFDLGYTSINAEQYVIYCVSGFSFCLYLYILERMFRDTFFGKWKIWDFLIKGAYIIFIFILLSPVLLLFNVIIFRFGGTLSKFSPAAVITNTSIISLISGLVGVVISIVSGISAYVQNKTTEKLIIQQQGFLELENGPRLFREGFYSQAILEAFKALETYLYNRLLDRDIRLPRYGFNEILKKSLKFGIVSEKDLTAINDLKGMRNMVAHSNTSYNRDDAEFALKVVKEIVARGKESEVKFSSKSSS
jgi:hypothetical protein